MPADWAEKTFELQVGGSVSSQQIVWIIILINDLLVREWSGGKGVVVGARTLHHMISPSPSLSQHISEAVHGCLCLQTSKKSQASKPPHTQKNKTKA